MIRYTLRCEKDHPFDGWFRDSAAFDTQAKRGFVACPECGSVRVEKTVMAPSVTRTDARGTRVTTLPAPVAPEAPQPVALVTEKEREMRAMLRAVKSFVEANSEDVGRRFPEEARKMHVGEIAERPIRGEAS